MNITTNKFKPSDLLLRLSTSFMWELLSPPATPRPQPSLRIPVTPANREWLRALRAAEAAAWEATNPATLKSSRLQSECNWKS